MKEGFALDPARRARLWAEFAALFLGVPVVMLVFFGSYPLFPVLLALALVAAGLLAATPGFSFAELLKGPVLGEWKLILGFALVVGGLCVAIAAQLRPEGMFWLPLERPGLWLMIMVLYPIASAAPQELIFRPLFFRRYGGLFATNRQAVTANAAIFGVGHLFYMNPLTILMSAGAGAVFALAYMRRGSFLLAVVLHAIAGQMVFTSGLGIYFYHGAVGR